MEKELSRKYIKQKKIKNRRIWMIIYILFIMFVFIFFYFKNDNTVYVDIESQKILNLAYHDNKNIRYHISESDFQEILHEMTHQKVVSTNKRGAVELSDKNVEAMLNILRKSSYKESQKYNEILSKWKKHNFNRIVQQHNFLWKKLKSPDGIAFRKMNQSTEFEFINQNFKK